MSQNRDAPAYQEYAASTLAKIPFRRMTLAERGLLYTLRLELWVNATLPSDTELLAKILGLDGSEVATSMPAVMPFIQIDGNVIFSPELNDYRKHLESRQTRMSEGGKRSAEARKEKRKPSSRHASAREASTLPTTLQAAHKGDGKVLVQQSSEKKSQTQPLKESLAVDSFVVDYVSEEKRIEPLVRGEL